MADTGGALAFWQGIFDQYPALADISKNNPEIAKLLAQAGAGNWTSPKFQAALWNTNWFKSQSDSQRTWAMRKVANPGEANQEMGQKVASIYQIAGTLGVKLTPDQIHQLADQSLGQAWSDSFLSSHIISTSSNLAPGTLTATQDSLRKTAADYGVNISDGTSLHWAQHIAQGTADQNGFADYVKGQAKVAHPYWEKQLDQGLSVRQLADPYIQQASQLLEVAPDTINLADAKKWDFSQTATNGQKTPLSQSDWANKLMSDPQYGRDATSNAKQAAFGVVQQLRQTFGAG